VEGVVRDVLPFGVLLTIVLSTGNAAAGTRDDGLLDPSWFSPDELEFREAGKLDYLWVRPGFSLDGKTIQFLPWATVQLPAERDMEDRAAAEKINESFPPRITEAFVKELTGKATIVPADGQLRVYGRLVDCNAGNALAYVWPHFTFELKFVDAEGNLQVAVHTRQAGALRDGGAPLAGKVNKRNLGGWAAMIAKPFAEGIESVWRKAKPSDL